MEMAVDVHYLVAELSSVSPTQTCPDAVEITECQLKTGRLNQFFYCWIGEDWAWLDKRSWSHTQWNEYAQNVRLFIIYRDKTPVGYYELGVSEVANGVELNYFGLADIAMGGGVGRYALEHALLSAKETGAEVMTVNTCSWDHPAALANYLARGFVEYRSEIEYRDATNQPKALA